MRFMSLPVVCASLTLCASFALTGCSSAGNGEALSTTPVVATETPSTPTDSAEVVVPDTSALYKLEGKTITLSAGDFYDLVLSSGPSSAWTATTETPGIVEWMPVETGSDGQPMSTLAAVGVGTTAVTLTDGKTSVSFSVTVTQ